VDNPDFGRALRLIGIEQPLSWLTSVILAPRSPKPLAIAAISVRPNTAPPSSIPSACSLWISEP
jgi:hypothetical protein